MKNLSTSQHHSLLTTSSTIRQDQNQGVLLQENQEQARCDWDFALSTVVSNSSSVIGLASDALGVTEFDPSGALLATGGIARKIRIYNLKSLLSAGSGNHGVTFLDHASACDYYICTPAKLSSLRWKPGSGGRVIGSGDYDGVVMEYDLERKIPVFERDEHGGRRVWSMDYSHWNPIIGASGSDDGSMQVWDPRCEGGICVAKGHDKTVTYARFMDHHTVVTSGTDGCLKMWDTDEPSRLVRTYKGHVNCRRFIGLSVWRSGGLICCGSENNQVFVYDRRWGEPIWVHELESMNCVGGTDGFVSSVGWRQVDEDECTLVAGGSDGVLQVFVGKRKKMPFL
ncbi:Ubiquitin ligase protein cop1 protein [Heracleum sosnowskyi]|uniref:Ubiquitin ligase protein cop1 protein n=1 Tax=Heracleum sosnowskyi TaxID=360622 RepID=A0AAD8J8B1_9APIA|nr:Ubiquitin ligase protein cop1 protein [Heracleum sosnowskyi]